MTANVVTSNYNFMENKLQGQVSINKHPQNKPNNISQYLQLRKPENCAD